MAKSISQKARKGNGRTIAFILFGIFLVVGVVVTYFTFVRPLGKVRDAKNWKKTPCVVISSEVKSHRSEDSTTYSAYIKYKYKVDGKIYIEDRYSFMGGSSSGHAGKQKIVAEYPPGKETFCYVNPNNPEEAVIIRDFTPAMLLGLIPVIFVLVGLGGIVGLVVSGKKKTARTISRSGDTVLRAAGESGHSIYDMVQRGPVTLEPKAGPIGKLVGVIIFSVFWNGILSIFIWQFLLSDRENGVPIHVKLFFIPFMLVGIATIFGIIYYLLALLNPKPELTISSSAVALGGAFELNWKMSGTTKRIHKMTISLEGREEATYRRGTNTYTDKNVFMTIPIAETTDQSEMMKGSGAIALPTDTMHSFCANNNKIIWTLKMRGYISRWPDVKQESEITVLPMQTGER